MYRLSAELLGKQARYGAAGNSEVRRTGKAKYRGDGREIQDGERRMERGIGGDMTVKPAGTG